MSDGKLAPASTDSASTSRTPSPRARGGVGAGAQAAGGGGASAVEVVVQLTGSGSATQTTNADQTTTSGASSAPFAIVNSGAAAADSALGPTERARFVHQRSQSLPEGEDSSWRRSSRGNNQDLRQARIDPTEEAEAPGRVAVATTQGEASSAASGGGAAGAGGCGGRPPGTVARPVAAAAAADGGGGGGGSDRVTEEGISIATLAHEFVFQALQLYNFTPGQLQAAGLNITPAPGAPTQERLIAQRLTEITKDLEKKGKLADVFGDVSKIDMTYMTFRHIASTLIKKSGSLTWGTIYSIFLLMQMAARIIIEKGKSLRQVLVWIGRFIVDELLNWIMEVGGGFLSLLDNDWSQKTKLAVAGVILAAAAGLAYWYWPKA